MNTYLLTEPCDPDIIKVDEDELRRISQLQAEHGNAQGDCFIKNYHNFQKLVVSNPHLKLVIMDVRYRHSGNKIRHCVCFDGDTQIDVSQGYNLRLDREYFENENYAQPSIKQYDILYHKIFDKSNLPSLEVILNNYGFYKFGMRLNKGTLPKLKGRWDNAMMLVI